MKKYLFTRLSFQIMVILAFGIAVTAVIQYLFSDSIIRQSILNSTKKQAYTYLLGVERQIRSLNDPFNEAYLTKIFRSAREHDVENLDFAILNIYMYDRLGKVVAYLSEPETAVKDMQGHYGGIIRSGKPYFGEEVEQHHINEIGEPVYSTDIIIPVHFQDHVIGGLEVEIDLNKTFAMIDHQGNRYEIRIILMIFAVLLLLLTFIWGILYLRLISPVSRISRVTGRIAKGDLGVRTDIRAKNEIGELGQSVNMMARNLEELFTELDATYMGTLNALAKALEAKDDYTANHSANVTRYAIDLGRYLGLDDSQVEILRQGAMLHDLGKIGVPDRILQKNEQLAGDEREIIKRHAVVTSDILKPLEKFKHFSAIARHHHERWDGRGYPDGLKGEDIPLLARIVAITDTWDAMTSDRVYRKAMDREQALEILERERNSGQWDPFLMERFIRLLRKNNLYQPISADKSGQDMA